MIDWDKVRKEFEETDITAKALADKHGIPNSTLHGRKKKENWKRKKKLRKATDAAGGQRQNSNAKDNDGGAPNGNKNAVSHGLFANFLPKETLEIMTMVHQMTPADMIWQNILIQYSAIVRAQKIMYVRDEFDDTSNVISVRVDPMFVDKDKNPVKTEEKRDWHMAYEKQERFLNAQSRAMSTLANLIKQFVSLADEDDERKLRLQGLQASINKAKAEAKISENKASKLTNDEMVDELLEALINPKLSDVKRNPEDIGVDEVGD